MSTVASSLAALKDNIDFNKWLATETKTYLDAIINIDYQSITDRANAFQSLVEDGIADSQLSTEVEKLDKVVNEAVRPLDEMFNWKATVDAMVSGNVGKGGNSSGSKDGDEKPEYTCSEPIQTGDLRFADIQGQDEVKNDIIRN